MSEGGGVVIIYEGSDQAVAGELCARLRPLVESGRLRLAGRDGLVTGEGDVEGFVSTVRSASFVVAVLSPALLQAPWLRREEVYYALKEFRVPRVRMLPVQWSRCLWWTDPVFRAVSPEPCDAQWRRTAITESGAWPSREAAWARVLETLERELQPVRRTVFTAPETVAVPAGEFAMGCADFEREQPVHRVRVRAFEIGKYPVTVGQFAEFVEDTGFLTEADRRDCSNVWVHNRLEAVRGVNWRCNAGGFAHAQDEADHPVVHVSWNDAQAYCLWLSRRTGHSWRLPSEAEWEYAARGGPHHAKSNPPYSGGADLDAVAWHAGNAEGQTHPVGTRRPNALGILDMSGNVLEWCADCWRDSYQEAGDDGRAFDTGDCSARVVRGGSWRSGSHWCRVSFRSQFAQSSPADDVGFRVVREVDGG